jgi:hypothetical protein
VTPTRLLGALALAVALAHLPFLPSTLEDIDSVNFALGVRDFDVAQHRPHPPGYPLYIAAGKAAVAALDAVGTHESRSALEARALALLSVIAAAALVFLLYRVFVCLAPPGDDRLRAPWHALDAPSMAAVALTLSCPLLWYLAARPMSDLPGLMFVAASQACLMLAWWRQAPSADGDRRMTPAGLAASGRMIVAGACLAGLAIGLRVQTGVLTLPLLGLVLIDRIGRGVAGAVIGASLTFAIGAVAWGVPLLVASGGLDAYMAALGTQAAEDFAGVQMLYLTPTPRLAAFAIMHTLVDPWDSWPLALVVLVLAALGAVALALRDRRALLVIAAMVGPYTLYHLLLQDTEFIRYAAPLVPAVSYLAVRGLVWIRPAAAVPAAGVLSIWSIAVAAPVLAQYGRESAPASRAVAAMNAEWRSVRPEALAMHQTYQRPLEAEDVAVSPQLPSPPRNEWLELVRFWNEGHQGTVWFLADPRRTDLSLVDPKARRDATDFLWSPASRLAFGGSRPAAARWIRIPAPGWFAEEGWALTPETAGIAHGRGRGPSLGPITARVRRRPGPVRVLIGGRNLSPDADATMVLAVDGAALDEWIVKPGFFLRTVELPAGRLEGSGPLAALTIESFGLSRDVPGPTTAVEQFDLQDPPSIMWGYDEGWYEAEFVPGLGVWRWTSNRAALRVAGGPVRLRVTLSVESPLRYFDLPVRARAMAGARELSSTTLGLSGERAIGATEDWSFEVTPDELAAAGGRVTIETDHTFVPAERGGSPDRRRLALRVFGVTIVPAS